MPIGIDLESMCRVENGLFVEGFANELQANRHSVDQTCWCGETWQTCQIDRQRINILHVHSDRVLLFRAKRKRHARCRGARNDIDLFEGAPEVDPPKVQG